VSALLITNTNHAATELLTSGGHGGAESHFTAVQKEVTNAGAKGLGKWLYKDTEIASRKL